MKIETQWNLGPALATLRKKNHELEQEIISETTKDILRFTPVDTGTLRGSWDIAFGNASLRRRVDRARRGVEPADPSPRGTKTYRRIMAKARRRRIGQNVKFQNRALYAAIVDQRQGYMNMITANWRNAVRRARLRVKGL